MSVLKASPSLFISRKLTLMITALIVAGLISGCASKKKQDILSQEERAELLQQKVEEFYSKAKKSLESGNYSTAVDDFIALQRIFPYGDITEQSKLDTIFAYDKLEEREKAVQFAEHFISAYPTHPNVDYAYYMKGVSLFEKKRGRMAKLLSGGEKNTRDPQSFRDSQAAFEELVKRYPDSKYSDDAKQRIVFIRNKLANRELGVAQFYFDNDTYLAAVNRCKTIIHQYDTTPSVEGALVLMEKAYAKMGLNELAQSTHDMLLLNFPDNQQELFKTEKKSFLKRLNPLSYF